MAKRNLDQQKADIERKIERQRIIEHARMTIEQLKGVLHARDFAKLADLAVDVARAARTLDDLAKPPAAANVAAPAAPAAPDAFDAALELPGVAS